MALHLTMGLWFLLVLRLKYFCLPREKVENTQEALLPCYSSSITDFSIPPLPFETLWLGFSQDVKTLDQFSWLSAAGSQQAPKAVLQCFSQVCLMQQPEWFHCRIISPETLKQGNRQVGADKALVPLLSDKVPSFCFPHWLICCLRRAWIWNMKAHEALTRHTAE